MWISARQPMASYGWVSSSNGTMNHWVGSTAAWLDVLRLPFGDYYRHQTKQTRLSKGVMLSHVSHVSHLRPCGESLFPSLGSSITQLEFPMVFTTISSVVGVFWGAWFKKHFNKTCSTVLNSTTHIELYNQDHRDMSPSTCSLLALPEGTLFLAFLVGSLDFKSTARGTPPYSSSEPTCSIAGALTAEAPRTFGLYVVQANQS